MNFASKSTFDSQGHPLLDFPLLMGHKLYDLTLMSREFSRSIKILDSMKVTGLSKIFVVVLKNLSSELPLILAKFFNLCRKKNCSLSFWKLSAVYKNACEHSFLSQYFPVYLLIVISKDCYQQGDSHLTRNNPLNNKLYGFQSSQSTANVLTVITYGISEALNDSNCLKYLKDF